MRTEVDGLVTRLTRGGKRRRAAVERIEAELLRVEAETAAQTGFGRREGHYGYPHPGGYIRWYTVDAARQVLRDRTDRARAARAAWLKELSRCRDLGRTLSDPTYCGPNPAPHRPSEDLRQARATARLEAWVAEMIYRVAVERAGPRWVCTRA